MDYPPHPGTPGAASMAIANIEGRLAQAQANTNQLRETGSQENYLESYFLVEALEIQLESLLKEQRARPAV
jgi:hypothetical protein